MHPKITVILPVYNSEKYLDESIQSVLNQTYTDFELLIYNDGSTDNSKKIIDGYIDSRIKKKHFESNIGLIKVLNLGIKDSKGEYIARMDADDYSLPDRFEKQIKFLEANGLYGICGTQIKIIDSEKEFYRPSNDEDLRWWIFNGSPFAHPSIMLRKSVLIQNNLNYNLNAYAAEDFDLWWRMAFHCKMYNLEQTLINYRIHDKQESVKNSTYQNENFGQSLNLFLDALHIDRSLYSSKFISEVLKNNIKSDPKTFIKSWNFFQCLLKSKESLTFFGKEQIQIRQKINLTYILKNLEIYSLSLIKFMRNKEFIRLLNHSKINKYVFAYKCLIRWKTRY